MSLHNLQRRFYFALALMGLMSVCALHFNQADKPAIWLSQPETGVRLSVLHVPGEIFPASRRGPRAVLR